MYFLWIIPNKTDSIPNKVFHAIAFIVGVACIGVGSTRIRDYKN